jgi:hypothetical protein
VIRGSINIWLKTFHVIDNQESYRCQDAVAEFSELRHFGSSNLRLPQKRLNPIYLSEILSKKLSLARVK